MARTSEPLRLRYQDMPLHGRIRDIRVMSFQSYLLENIHRMVAHTLVKLSMEDLWPLDGTPKVPMHQISIDHPLDQD